MKLNLFRCIGGKSYMANNIVKLLDYNCMTYIEPFCGGSNVFLNKPPHKVEIINDKDDNIITLYKILKSDFNRFIKELDKYCYSEKLFKDMYKKFKNKEYKNEIEKAVWFFCLKNMSFVGAGTSFGYGFEWCINRDFFNKKEKLKYIAKRIENAQILCKDYKDILLAIKPSKQKIINIYVDPPYYGAEHYYDIDFPKEEHYKLAEILNSLKECKIIVSYYYFDGIENLYPKDKWIYKKYVKIKHSTALTIQTKLTKKNKSEELLIMNYKPKTLQENLLMEV